ncbi:membrane metallo-endopeptidase-like 1 [Drosophila ficusphila]|uniref:membrane metallo-endopeptidase-like 1 n=1 Tax=Drosophila ficusphila TaxID=30025 RepID=UPI001C896319|nr:membrane metallo-endopeptidase-like 1 [Drosophila ficusphila]
MPRTKTVEWITFSLVLLSWAKVEAGWVAPPTTPHPNEMILNRLLGYMDTKANPCQDFQKYAGGKYEDQHEDDSYSELLGEMQSAVNDRFLAIFETLSAQVLIDQESVEAKVLRFYQTCRTATNESRSEKHYLQLVEPDVAFTWPQFARSRSAWPKSQFQWMHTLARLRRFGFDNLLVKVNVKLDFVDSSKYMVTIDRPTFDDATERLKNFASTKKLLIRLGVARGRALAMAKNIKRLESAVRQLADVEDEPNDDLTLRELESQNGLPWRQYLRILFGRSFPENFEVQIQNVDYFVELKKLMDTYDAEVIAIYMMARFARFMKETSQSDAENEAYECIKDTRIHMDFGSNFLYESKHFSDYNTEVQEIFNAVRAPLLARIEANRLKLSPRQKNELKQKIQSINLNVGNKPRNQNHRTFVTNFYRDLQLPKDQDYAAAQLKALEIRSLRVLELLDQPAPKGDSMYSLSDTLGTTTPEPTYQIRENTIFLPTDVLQSPFFVPQSHDVFKVSFLGFMIAQKLVEALLPQSLLYTAIGNPTIKFAEIETNENYAQGLNCLKSNATEYLDQRVVDVTALKMVYEAYFGAGSKFSQLQPSFTTMTLPQLFFLNYAQNLIGDEEHVEFVGEDPDKVRLHQTLANLAGFGQAFNCPYSSPLNPVVKCDVW